MGGALFMPPKPAKAAAVQRDRITGYGRFKVGSDAVVVGGDGDPPVGTKVRVRSVVVRYDGEHRCASVRVEVFAPPDRDVVLLYPDELRPLPRRAGGSDRALMAPPDG